MYSTTQGKKLYSYLPYAQYAYSYIANRVKNIDVNRVLDIASARFVNKKMFKAEMYIGVDINIENLKSGLSKFKNEKAIGCYADVANLPKLNHVADLVISTFTLISLKPPKRLEAIKHFIDYVNVNGTLFIEMPNHDIKEDALLMMKSNFEQVETIYFNSILTRKFSDRFLRFIKLEKHPSLAFYLVPVLSTLFETCFPNISKCNQNVFIIGTRKKRRNPKFTNDFNGFSKLGNKLYSYNN